MSAVNGENINFTFSTKLKLTTKPAFDHVFKCGKKISANKFAVFFIPNNLLFSRLGVIVSKKNAKIAVVRNRFKRIVKESFRNNQHSLIGFDIIVLAYREVDRLTKKELRECLDKQLKKLAAVVK